MNLSFHWPPRALTLLIAVLLLSACTPNRAYRYLMPPPDPASCTGSQPSDCATEVWHRLRPNTSADLRNPQEPVYLGFVEFDDQGALHDPLLKDEVITRIRSLSERHSVLLVVFAHGWKHNASAKDSNVEDFSNLLRRIAWYDEQVCAGRNCAARRVVGLYMGWRGLSARLEPFKAMSFWARKERAHRVGTYGATEVLAELSKIKANGLHPTQNRLVVTGHSFGGALIYNALQQQLVRDTAFVGRSGVLRNAANLVVLVNPAFEAARFGALERRGRILANPPSQRPVLAVFTSRKDTATRTAFPLGRSLSTLFESHVSLEQRNQNLTALGHYEPFLTHDLNLSAATSGDANQPLALSSLHDVGCAWQNFQSGRSDAWSLGAMELSRRERMLTGTQRQNPYYNVSVDPGIVASHSEIWGERFSEFLYRFVAVQSLPAGVHCERDAD